jgi:hypothetical protein
MGAGGVGVGVGAGVGDGVGPGVGFGGGIGPGPGFGGGYCNGWGSAIAAVTKGVPTTRVARSTVGKRRFMCTFRVHRLFIMRAIRIEPRICAFSHDAEPCWASSLIHRTRGILG